MADQATQLPDAPPDLFAIVPSAPASAGPGELPDAPSDLFAAPGQPPPPDSPFVGGSGYIQSGPDQPVGRRAGDIPATTATPQDVRDLAAAAVRGATFNQSDRIGALAEGALRSPGSWTERALEAIAPEGSPFSQPYPAGSTFDDRYKASMDRSQAAADDFARRQPLAAKIAFGAGAAPLILPAAGAAVAGTVRAITPLAARLMRGGLTREAAETVARTTAPTTAASLAGNLVKPSAQIAGGLILPSILKKFMPEGMAEMAADVVGLGGAAHGAKQAGEVLFKYLRQRAIDAARARLMTGEMPGPPPPEAVPEAPPSEAAPPPYEMPPAPPASSRPLLEVPPGYRWGEGPTPGGGPSSWGAYRGGP